MCSELRQHVYDRAEWPTFKVLGAEASGVEATDEVGDRNCAFPSG